MKEWMGKVFGVGDSWFVQRKRGWQEVGEDGRGRQEKGVGAGRVVGGKVRLLTGKERTTTSKSVAH